MLKLTHNQINAADAILKYTDINGSMSAVKIFAKNLKNDWDMNDITYAAEYLKNNDFITFVTSFEGHQYRLTDMGLKFKQDNKSIIDYLQEEYEKEAKQAKQNELDEGIKKLQYQDFHDKVHKLNPATITSLSDTWKRHWMVISVSFVALLIAFLTFIFKR